MFTFIIYAYTLLRKGDNNSYYKKIKINLFPFMCTKTLPAKPKPRNKNLVNMALCKEITDLKEENKKGRKG